MRMELQEVHTLRGKEMLLRPVTELSDHSPECRDTIVRANLYRLTWAMQHPGYCRTCDGWGGHVSYGVRYYPDGSGEPDSYDECPDCVGADVAKCPHCGEPLPIVQVDTGDPEFLYDTETVFRCDHCAWDMEDHQANEGMHPADVECFCDVFGDGFPYTEEQA